MASKKLRSATADTGQQTGVDMSPMIDMVFLLLIFFIVASNIVDVRIDDKVKPPVAEKSEKVDDARRGRVIVNIREDGTFLGEDTKNVFANMRAIEEYVREKKDAERARGRQALIHLRADKNVPFKHTRTVIRAAANAGVNNVIFSVYGFENEN